MLLLLLLVLLTLCHMFGHHRLKCLQVGGGMASSICC